MDASPFAKLALELRLDIYELVLRRSTFKLSNKLSNTRHCKDYYWHEESHLLALTATCKQLRHEASPVFYKINCFVISPRIWTVCGNWNPQLSSIYRTELTVCRRWLKTIGSRNASAIKHLTIELGDWEVAQLQRPSGKWWSHARKIEKRLLHSAGLHQGAINTAFRMRHRLPCLPESMWLHSQMLRTNCQFESGSSNAEIMMYTPDMRGKVQTMYYQMLKAGCPLQDDCWSGKYAMIMFLSTSFSMSTDGKEIARAEVEKQHRHKLKILASHERHADCYVALHMTSLRQSAEKAFENIKGMLSDQVSSWKVDGGLR